MLQCYRFKQIWTPFVTDNTATPASHFESFRKSNSFFFAAEMTRVPCQGILHFLRNRIESYLKFYYRGALTLLILLTLSFSQITKLQCDLFSQSIHFKIVSKAESNKIPFKEYLKEESKDKDTIFKSDSVSLIG